MTLLAIELEVKGEWSDHYTTEAPNADAMEVASARIGLGSPILIVVSVIYRDQRIYYLYYVIVYNYLIQIINALISIYY